MPASQECEVCGRDDCDKPREWGCYRIGYARAIAQRDAARADVIAAAGELLVPIPAPGTTEARMLLANMAMRRERDTDRATVRHLAEERRLLTQDNALLRNALEALRAEIATLQFDREGR